MSRGPHISVRIGTPGCLCSCSKPGMESPGIGANSIRIGSQINPDAAANFLGPIDFRRGFWDGPEWFLENGGRRARGCAERECFFRQINEKFEKQINEPSHRVRRRYKNLGAPLHRQQSSSWEGGKTVHLCGGAPGIKGVTPQRENVKFWVRVFWSLLV